MVKLNKNKVCVKRKTSNEFKEVIELQFYSEQNNVCFFFFNLDPIGMIPLVE